MLSTELEIEQNSDVSLGFSLFLPIRFPLCLGFRASLPILLHCGEPFSGPPSSEE